VAKRLNNASLAIVDKRREKANISKVMHIIGEVEGRDCLIVDDMIDTAGTLTQTAQALVDAGATHVIAACTHPVLSDPANERIDASVLSKVIVTDTIPRYTGRNYSSKIEVVTVAGMLGDAIERIHEESSISSLFDF
jgi:ribose-phosphate pyrophosphokinase